MIALQMTSTKNFMQQFLAGEAFDPFLLVEATIATANTYSIDGRMNADFFPAEERDTLPYEFQPWSEIKGLCFHLIKGKNTPLHFKFVLHLKPEKAEGLLSRDHSDISVDTLKALVLTVKYDGSKVVLTTGTAYRTFVMDKEADVLWDKALMQYLAGKEIGFEQLN